jgi:CheY-like chemotaxis protein
VSGAPDRKRRKTALVVEDEQVVVDALRKVLEFERIDVESAGDVADARRLLEKRAFEALFTDIMLPGESGEVLLEDRAASDPAMPVIVITGFGTADLILRTLAGGAFEFLAKPFSFEELSALCSRLRRFLGLPLEERAALLGGEAETQPSAGPCFTLGSHSWARAIDRDRVAVGAGRLLARTAGSVVEIRPPQPGEEIAAGQACLRLVDADGHEHGLRTPLSGRVQAVHEDERPRADVGVEEEVLFRRELFTMTPKNLAVEAAKLVRGPRGCGR